MRGFGVLLNHKRYFGHLLLLALTSGRITRVMAEVERTNIGSVRTLQKCGCRKCCELDEFDWYERTI